MKLFVTPRAGTHNQEVQVEGETVFIDGEPIDLSGVPDLPGYAEPEGLPFAEGRIIRVKGELYVNLVVFFDEENERCIDAPNDDDLVFTLTSGTLPPVSVPIVEAEIEEEPVE